MLEPLSLSTDRQVSTLHRPNSDPTQTHRRRHTRCSGRGVTQEMRTALITGQVQPQKKGCSRDRSPRGRQRRERLGGRRDSGARTRRGWCRAAAGTGALGAGAAAGGAAVGAGTPTERDAACPAGQLPALVGAGFCSERRERRAAARRVAARRVRPRRRAGEDASLSGVAGARRAEGPRERATTGTRSGGPRLGRAGGCCCCTPAFSSAAASGGPLPTRKRAYASMSAAKRRKLAGASQATPNELIGRR